MLANKVVLITGVGSGLGRALAEGFVRQGSNVAGIARRDDSLQSTAAPLDAERFICHVADVTDFTAVSEVVRAVIARYGRIDLLFNNAAVYPRVSFMDESAADWARAIDVNVNGVANCCKAVLPSMLAAGYGRIYNVGSFADIAPIVDSAAYAASKGGVRALTKAIAADLQPRDVDIEVHEWIPGHLKTRMSDFTGIDPAVAAAWAVQLARMPHARARNCIFETDHEWLPPKRLRQRIVDKLKTLAGLSR